MEFSRNSEEASYQHARLLSAWKRIEEELQYIAEFWPNVSSQNLGPKTTIERAETDHWQMNGSALGKKFMLTAVPVTFGINDQRKLFAQLLVSVAHPCEEKLVTVAHVLLDKDGTIYSTPSEPVLSHQDSAPHFKLLVSIINCVLAADLSGA